MSRDDPAKKPHIATVASQPWKPLSSDKNSLAPRLTSDCIVNTVEAIKDDDATDFGDCVSTEDEEIELEEVVEPWDKYDRKATPNVFYPICLGDVLNERYLVEHKIGAGGFSTVWMALDLQENKEVAVKVMATGDSGDIERRIQDEIVQRVEDTSHLVTYMDTFMLFGNNCHHRVMVLPLMGPCLDRYTVGRFSIATRMSAAKQLLEALETLHKAGIVHRDLNERNCMWGMAPLQHLSRSAKYKALGRPLKQTIPSVELWKRGELVRPMEVPENLRTDDFHLGDFGLAMKIGDPVAQSGYPPMQFCSPERLHGIYPSFACDMWSYMINFSELYLRQPPFNPWYRGGVLTSIVNFLGPLPEEWKGRYIYSDGHDSWYDRSQLPAPKNSLASEIARYRPDADPAERELVLSIMQKVFIYSPEKRLTATQLLGDPSFKALMARYGC
ncbi:kinase-like protein [Aspergillus similis]